MTSDKTKQSLLPGVILILLGLWFLTHNLLDDFLIWEQVYPILLLGFSAALLVEAFWHKRSGPLFWGVFVLCVGLFHLLRAYDVIPYLYFHEYWPAGLTAAGFGLLVVYLVMSHDASQLIFSIILMLVGFALFTRTAYGMIGDLYISEWLWPAALIVGGAGLIYRGLRQN